MTSDPLDNVDPGWIDRCKACGLEGWYYDIDVTGDAGNVCRHCDAVNVWVPCALCKGRGETSWSYVQFQIETWGWEACSACGGLGRRMIVQETAGGVQ